MDLVSLCPLHAASFVWSNGSAGLARTVVCKATFQLVPERARLAEEQDPIHSTDEYWDDDPARSLYASSDLVPKKSRADVILVGRAFAPGPEPVAAIVARLAVGAIDKSIAVHCDRAWSDAGQLLEGPWFTSMPLVYERAAGGPSTWNPVGVRADARPGPDGLLRLPNLAPKGLDTKRRGERIAPVGFGPIAPAWPNRLAKLGPYAARATDAMRELPDDLDVAFFNAAPKDQQLDTLRADERIVLEGLDRQHARLATALPGIRPRVFVVASGPRRELAMTLDTLWIDTDRALATLAWRGTFPIASADAAGRIIVAIEGPDQPLAWADIEAKASLASAASEPNPERGTWEGQPPEARPFDVERTDVELAEVDRELTALPKRPRRPVLPFQPSDGKGQRAPPLSAPSGAPPPVQCVPQAPPPRPGGADPAKRPSNIGAWSPPGSAASREVPFMSALGASNAALGDGHGARPLAARPEARDAAGAEARARAAEVVEVLWCDPAFMPRVRARSAWRSLLASNKPPAEEDGDAKERKKEARDLRDALAVLRRGEPLDAAGIDAALDEATRDGAFTPLLALAYGSLEVPFDERATLKATLAHATPFAAGDKKLKELCDATRDLLESPWLEKGSAGLDGFVASLREAFAKSARGLGPGYLEARTERLLLEQRAYQTRMLLGEAWVRGLFTPPGADGALPLYLPEAAAKQLPLFSRFRACVIAELRLQLDQHESSASALRCVALGRLVAPPRRALTTA